MKKDVIGKGKEERAENKIQNSLPKIEPLPGAVCVQFKRCGKANCKCAKGELHGGYYYRFYYVAGKLRKKYVKKGEIEAVKAACLQHKLTRLEMRMLIEESKRDWRRLKQLLKDCGL